MSARLEILVLHCTATEAGKEVTPEDIKKWHLSPVSEGGRGWSKVGYSDMILIGGEIVNLIKYNDDDKVDAWEISNGVLGINHKSRHVVYAGGVLKGKPNDTRTKEQTATMKEYVLKVIKRYPHIKVAGHNQFANKACPSFDVPTWLKSIGVNEKNIYKV